MMSGRANGTANEDKLGAKRKKQVAKKGNEGAKPEKKVAKVVEKKGIDDILLAMGGSAKPEQKVATVVEKKGIDDILLAMGGSARRPTKPQSSDDAPHAGAPLPPLDSAHRVAGPSGVDFQFRCAALRMDASEAAELCNDCSLVFKQQEGSNWVPATAAPRCALERLALAIFAHHTAGVLFDKERSGAEWWAQVRDGGQQQEGIEFHWDVDEHFCDGSGVHVHPTLSTVTYLTSVGAPTLILNTRGTPASAATSEVAAKVHGPISSGGLSYPRVGKHIVFDGSRLHGAVPCRGGEAPSGARRVTFLVNLWLHHHPFAVERLPATLANAQRGAWQPHAQRGAFCAAAIPPPEWRVEADAMASGAQQLQVSFGRNAKAHALRVLLPPKEPLRGAGGERGRESEGSWRLLFAPGTAGVSANTGGSNGMLKPAVSRGPNTGGGPGKLKQTIGRDSYAGVGTGKFKQTISRGAGDMV